MTTQTSIDFGRLLRAHLAARRLTIRQLARALGTKADWVSRRLAGHQPWRQRDQLAVARALGVPLDELAAGGSQDLAALLGPPDETGLPTCRAYRPLPGRGPNGECLSCQGECAFAPTEATDADPGGAP